MSVKFDTHRVECPAIRENMFFGFFPNMVLLLYRHVQNLISVLQVLVFYE